MKITEENVLAAAERLYSKGEITKEELDGLSKEAGFFDSLGGVFKKVSPTPTNLLDTFSRGAPKAIKESVNELGVVTSPGKVIHQEASVGEKNLDAVRLGILGALGLGATSAVGMLAKSDATGNLASAVAKKVLPGSISGSMFPKKSIVDLMGRAAVPTVVGIGLAAAGYKAFDQIKQRVDAARTLTEIQNDPQFADKDPDQVADYFGVVKSFSPSAATNPLVASALVNKMMQFGGVDHKLVQDLTSIEGDRKDYMADELVSDAMKSFVQGVTGRIGE